MNKIAILFPGVGYHKDKPLLYYSAKLAKAAGYEVYDLRFAGVTWEKGSLNDPEKMMDLFRQVYHVAEEQLTEFHFAEDAEYLFVSKSIGTAVAACYAGEHGIAARHIFFSPVEQFPGSKGGIAFAGDQDPIADYDKVEKVCRKSQTELHRIPGGNHSLETGNVKADLEMLQRIMMRVEDYITGNER